MDHVDENALRVHSGSWSVECAGCGKTCNMLVGRDAGIGITMLCDVGTLTRCV